MKRKKISLDKLFYDNKFALLFSLLLSLILWLKVAIEFSPLEERIVKDVPVKIENSQSVQAFDLNIFGNENFFVDITVKGKRFVVAQRALTADDIIVTASTNYVDSAGKYSLKLDVRKKNESADFEIIKLSEEHIDVYYDVYKEIEFPLTIDIKSDTSLIPKGYYKDDEILSEKSVLIAGPATEVNKVKKVYARVKLENELTATQTFEAKIVPVDEYAASPRFLTINNDNVDISLTIPVYKQAQLPVELAFKNAPLLYLENPPTYSVTPGFALFGIEENILEDMTAVDIGTVDFSELKPGENKFNFKSSDVKEAKVLDKTEQFTVVIKLEKNNEKTLDFKKSNVSILRLTENAKAEPIKMNFSEITVYGSSESLENITRDDIFAEVDFNNEEIGPGLMTKPVKIFAKGYDDCWVYGKYEITYDIKID